MVFTLHRYIFREIFRVFLLATVALTLILNLGMILRPVQEYGVGPRQVIHLIGYFSPITLTFVLPIAALFATALVYGRFANDNELDACRASGIGLLTLVYPGLALAIMVAIANLILSFYVMPAFVHRAEKSLKADAKQILFRNIQRRGYYEMPGDGRFLIYADHADSKKDILSGVVIAEMKGSKIKKITTADSAKVSFNPHERFNEVRIVAHNTYQMSGDDEGGFFAKWMPVTAPFPSLMGDNIKFKKIDEIKKIEVDPMLFYPIEALAREAYAQFTAELLAEDISAKIAEAPEGNVIDGNVVDVNGFYKLYSGQSLIEFTANSCEARNDKDVLLSGGVVIIEYDPEDKQPLQTLHATRAFMHIEGDELAPTLTMEVYSPVWKKFDGTEGLAVRHVIRGLILPQAVTDKFKTENILETISPASTAAALKNGSSDRLIGLQGELQKKILKTLIGIKAETHSRLVFGIGCISMIMIGIGLGIIKKGGHLLSAFGVSAMPATALIVCIMMGKNITKNVGSQGVSGILLMWVGLALLTLLAVMIYRKLLKN